MEKTPKKLRELVEQQEKQILLYQSKLRDTVQAYKSVVKEKEALESTIKTFKTELSNDGSDKKSSGGEDDSDASDGLKQQMATLLDSIATLTAEKSKMESNFRSDKKRLREEKEYIENKCQLLEEELNKLKLEVDGLKSKQIVERYEIANNDSRLHQVEKYDKTVTSLTNELESTKRRLELSEKKLKETPLELTKLQDEMRNLQIEHQTALHSEKERVKMIEERYKKLSSLQEERVVNLETQLLELSQTIGTYDRLRVQDQLEIQKLKEHIALGCIEPAASGAAGREPEKVELAGSEDISEVVEKILDLKVKLSNVSEKSGKKVDFLKLFADADFNLHASCTESYNKLKKDYELLKADMKLCESEEKPGKEVFFLQNQVKNLQERVRILSEKNEEMQRDYQIQIDQLKMSMKSEKARLKETLASTESDYRGRLWLLEEQLEKQRERSLALLEEKEQEIQSLQNTFHVFMPGYRRKSEDETNNTGGLGINQVRDGPHILHYANELARRDIEICNLRKSKHQSETALRELQKIAAADAEKHRDERQALRDEIGRLKLCQTREGANLEYLKNVVLSFLLSKDARSKRHMCNAIAAVLKFSESELARVTEHSKNSWRHPGLANGAVEHAGSRKKRISSVRTVADETTDIPVHQSGHFAVAKKTLSLSQSQSNQFFQPKSDLKFF